VVGLATARARARIEAAVGRRPALEALVERVGRREIDPVSAAEEILTAVLGGDGDDAAGAR
jgi:hypothetical protein